MSVTTEERPVEKSVKKAFQIPEAKEDEIYSGTIINPDGTGHHIFLVQGEIDNATWKAAKAWAEGLGGDLPTRVEQSLMFDKLRDQFQKSWYWSGVEYEHDSSYAWFQYFDNGSQHDTLKNRELRARAVRRLPI